MSELSKSKNKEIEVLRGIAVLLTMISHIPFLLPFYAEFFAKVFYSKVTPWTGVDLFFCISGYVVSKAYLEDFDDYRNRGQYWLAAQKFFIRRAYRLLPSAWLWAGAGLLCAIWFNRSGVFASWFDNLRSLLVIMTFTGNYANQHGLLLHPNHVYWSLALEEQFYFLFPIFLFFVQNTRWRVGVLALLIVIQFVISRNPFGTPFEGMASSFRLDAIMWGVLIYFLSRSPWYRYFEPIFLRGKLVAIFVLGLLLYMLVAIPAQLIGMPIAVGMIAVVTALLVFMASYEMGYILHVPLISPVMIWVGARSYGIYLIHLFAYRFTYEGFTRYAEYLQVPLDYTFTKRLFISGVVLTFLLAEVNYRFLEVPLRNFGSRIARRRAQFSVEVSSHTPTQ